MTGTELATIQGNGALALRSDQTDWNEAQRAALEQLGVTEAPKGDQLVFLHVAQQMRLDPFNKEIYLIGRWDPELGRKKWTIQIGIDGFRSKSEEHAQFGGIEPAEWCGPDGQWTDVWLADEPPKAARFTVYRRDQKKPIRCVALYSEYVQKKKDGNPTQRWRNAPTAQLAKCAEALTRRTAFPRHLGGVYAHEEMEHLDNAVAQPVVIQSERADQPAEPDWDALIRDGEAARDVVKLADTWKLARGMRPNDTALLDRIAQAAERVKAAVLQAAEPAPATKPPSEARMNRLFALLAEAGIKTTPKRHELAGRVLGREVTSFADLSAEQVELLIRRLEQRNAEATQVSPDDTPAEQPEQQPADPEGDQQ